MSSDVDLMDSNDLGGVGAKQGFLFQDYAAAYYLISMLRDKRLKSVRCEVTDDIDLVFDDHIEYVQVKTTDDDGKWTLNELCTTSKIKKVKGKRSVKPKDSILHKSLSCDKNNSKKSKFKILSRRDVRANLMYLKIKRDRRDSKDGKDALLKSLKGKIGDFKSENGHDVEYWIDNCYWEVFSSISEIQVKSTLAILQAAASLNVYLDPNRDPQRILNDILSTLTMKSAISRKIHVSADKSYEREEFLLWFDEELNQLENKSKTHKKIYSRNSEDLKPVLVQLVDLSDEFDDGKEASGLYQGYERRKYRYDYISKTIKEWLPELLLRPDELADSFGTNLVKSYEVLAKRLDKEFDNFESFIGKLLLHSTIRFYTKSQPIPATLFIDDDTGSKEFDNIHIVKKDHSGDELWMGFSKLTNGQNIDNSLDELCIELSTFLSDDFSSKKERILDVKQDGYLVSHDINEILDSSISFDEHIDRFRFVIFIGYESEEIDIKISREEQLDFKDRLIEEVSSHFKLFIDKLVVSDDFFDELNITVYLFPTPCIDTLLSKIKLELQGGTHAY